MKKLAFLAVFALTLGLLISRESAAQPTKPLSQEKLAGDWTGTWTGAGTLKTGDPIDFSLDEKGKVTGIAEINGFGKIKVTGQLTLADAKTGKLTGQLKFKDAVMKTVDMSVAVEAGKTAAMRIKGTTEFEFVLDVKKK